MRSLRGSIAAVGLILTAATSAGCKADIGDPCTSTDDCEFGLVCVVAMEGGPTVCQLPPVAADMTPAADMTSTDQSDMVASEGGL